MKTHEGIKDEHMRDGKIEIYPPDEGTDREVTGKPGMEKSFEVVMPPKGSGPGPTLLIRSPEKFRFNGILAGEASKCQDGQLGDAYCGLFDLAAMYRERGDTFEAVVEPTVKNQMFLFNTLRTVGR